MRLPNSEKGVAWDINTLLMIMFRGCRFSTDEGDMSLPISSIDWIVPSNNLTPFNKNPDLSRSHSPRRAYKLSNPFLYSRPVWWTVTFPAVTWDSHAGVFKDVGSYLAAFSKHHLCSLFVSSAKTGRKTFQSCVRLAMWESGAPMIVFHCIKKCKLKLF